MMSTTRIPALRPWVVCCGQSLELHWRGSDNTLKVVSEGSSSLAEIEQCALASRRVLRHFAICWWQSSTGLQVRK